MEAKKKELIGPGTFVRVTVLDGQGASTDDSYFAYFPDTSITILDPSTPIGNVISLKKPADGDIIEVINPKDPQKKRSFRLNFVGRVPELPRAK